jgi:hypothetical protein
MCGGEESTDAAIAVHRGSGNGTWGRFSEATWEVPPREELRSSTSPWVAARRGVGEAHSTDEAGESRWREGASLLVRF